MRQCFLLLLSFFCTLTSTAQTASSSFVSNTLRVQIQATSNAKKDLQSIRLLCSAAHAKIFYTLDGATPNAAALRYHADAPIEILKTTAVRAIAIVDGRKSAVVTQTFLLSSDATSTLPTFALCADPDALFDTVRGLMVQGTKPDSSKGHLHANYWSQRELRCHVEMFERDGQRVLAQNAGWRIFGGWSRLFPQKSIALAARKRYGTKTFRYPFFGKNGLKKYKHLVLRNGGSDFGKAHCRDEVITSLYQNNDLNAADNTAVRVFINGKYWGVYHLREKINQHFLIAHHRAQRDSFDLIEHLQTLHVGSLDDYRALTAFLQQNNLKDSAVMKTVARWIDVNQFLKYEAFQIYADNVDAWGNIKYWRPHNDPQTPWRWLLYDADNGFGLLDSTAYRHNMLLMALDAHGAAWPNPAWATFLLRKLVENPVCRQQFINHFQDLAATDFEPTHVRAVIDSFERVLQPEMPRHCARWGLSLAVWRAQMSVLHQFADQRPAHISAQLQQLFHLGNAHLFTLDSAVGKGTVWINGMARDAQKKYQAHYFDSNAVTIRAVAAQGFRFSHWQFLNDQTQTNSPSLTFFVRDTLHVRAVFEPYQSPFLRAVVINEISPRDQTSGEWLELYNRQNRAIRLDDWTLTDGKHTFRLPKLTLAAHDFVVLCADSARFGRIFGNCRQFVGNVPFGFRQHGDALQLYDANAQLIAEARYEITELPDSAYTLTLVSPMLDGADAAHWAVTNGNGSPAAHNEQYARTEMRSQQLFWWRIGAAIAISGLLFGYWWVKRVRLFH